MTGGGGGKKIRSSAFHVDGGSRSYTGVHREPERKSTGGSMGQEINQEDQRPHPKEDDLVNDFNKPEGKGETG